MLAIPVTITCYLSDEPQPGVVACELVDVHGRLWRFVEKTAIVSSDHLDGESAYPQPGVIAGVVVSRSRNAKGREVCLFDTRHPWDVESVDGVTQFEVLAETLVEM
jgi:hypothetical protein